MTFPATLSRTERILLCLALVVVILLGIKTAGSIITIVLVALILTLLLYPATRWLHEKGLPAPAAVGVVTVIAALCIALIVVLTISSFNMIIADLPQYQEDLALRLGDITAFLGAHGFGTGQFFPATPDLGNIIPALLSSLLNLGGVLMDIFFIAVTTFFMLLEAPQLIERVESMLHGEPEKLRHLSRMSGFVIDFIVVRTETNLVHGLLFGGVLAIMGVHAAILWGVLTFILGYIPVLRPCHRGDPRHLLCLAPVRDLGSGRGDRACLYPQPDRGEPGLFLACGTQIRDPGTGRHPLGHLLGLAARACRHALCRSLYADAHDPLPVQRRTPLDQYTDGCREPVWGERDRGRSGAG